MGQVRPNDRGLFLAKVYPQNAVNLTHIAGVVRAVANNLLQRQRRAEIDHGFPAMQQGGEEFSESPAEAEVPVEQQFKGGLLFFRRATPEDCHGYQLDILMLAHQLFQQLRWLRPFTLQEQPFVLAKEKVRLLLRLINVNGFIRSGQAGLDTLTLQHHQVSQRALVHDINDGFARL